MRLGCMIFKHVIFRPKFIFSIIFVDRQPLPTLTIKNRTIVESKGLPSDQDTAMRSYAILLIYGDFKIISYLQSPCCVHYYLRFKHTLDVGN